MFDFTQHLMSPPMLEILTSIICGSIPFLFAVIRRQLTRNADNIDTLSKKLDKTFEHYLGRQDTIRAEAVRGIADLRTLMIDAIQEHRDFLTRTENDDTVKRIHQRMDKFESETAATLGGHDIRLESIEERVDKLEIAQRVKH